MIDVYHPYDANRHYDTCAGLCTDYGEFTKGHCTVTHCCWCPDGALSYKEFQAKHPDVVVAEA